MRTSNGDSRSHAVDCRRIDGVGDGRLIFDEEKKSITIETASKNTLILDDAPADLRLVSRAIPQAARLEGPNWRGVSLSDPGFEGQGVQLLQGVGT